MENKDLKYSIFNIDLDMQMSFDIVFDSVKLADVFMDGRSTWKRHASKAKEIKRKTNP